MSDLPNKSLDNEREEVAERATGDGAVLSDSADAKAKATPAEQPIDELTRAEERLRAVEAELEAARARVDELRKGASYPQQPPIPGESAAAKAAAAQAAWPQEQPFAPPSYGRSRQSADPAGYQPPSGQPQRPFGQMPYAQPYAQQPYTAPAYGQQPYAQQPYASRSYVPPSYVVQPMVTKDHVAAGLLAIFLGVFGVHKFYLGYNTAGFIMLAVTVLGSIFTIGLAAGVMWIIAVIEGIIYLAKSQSEFDAVYVANKKEWF